MISKSSMENLNLDHFAVRRNIWSGINGFGMHSFEVLTGILLEIEAFMDGTPCRLVNSHRRFGGS